MFLSPRAHSYIGVRLERFEQTDTLADEFLTQITHFSEAILSNQLLRVSLQNDRIAEFSF
jgi:hypothetical protein